jgi:hypothetical protein
MLLRNLAIASTLAIAAPAVAVAADAPVAAEVQKTPAAAPQSSDSHNYAQREAQDKKTADYQGGDLLIVGISGGAIIVLLFLLLILA